MKNEWNHKGYRKRQQKKRVKPLSWGAGRERLQMKHGCIWKRAWKLNDERFISSIVMVARLLIHFQTNLGWISLLLSSNQAGWWTPCSGRCIKAPNINPYTVIRKMNQVPGEALWYTVSEHLQYPYVIRCLINVISCRFYGKFYAVLIMMLLDGS